MGARSGIEWTDATWNPISGCTKVSQGCKHCYAERLFARFDRSDPIEMREGSFVEGLRPRHFTDIMLHPDRLALPLHWRKPRRIFVNSMSDLFHEQVPVEFIARAFNVMADARCEEHVFQILTKRAGRMWRILSQLLPDHVGESWGGDTALGACLEADAWPLPNVWLGVSAEDQPTLDARWPYLRDTPAAVRFLSLEPMLGPIILDWRTAREVRAGYHTARDGSPIHWVIVGGESGGPPERALVEAEPRIGDRNWRNRTDPRRQIVKGWKPKDSALTWVRALRDQCVAAGVPFFFKQWGGVTPKSGGRLLDGRTWEEYPA